jgi:hypothetical protein
MIDRGQQRQSGRGDAGDATARSPCLSGWRIAALVLVGLDLWLASGRLPSILEAAAVDDALFARLAASIARSGWLGPYDALTLAKGPVFPGVMAAAFVLGIPLPPLLQAIYAGAALTAAAALRAFLPHPGSRLAILALVLFNPAATAFDRLERERLYPALALLAMATAIGLYGAARRGRPAAGWGVALGVAVGLFWLTREEGLWLVPALALLLGAAGLARLRDAERTPHWRALAGVLLPPLALFLAVDLSVAAANRAAYGVFETNEFREPAFRHAYGALLRVLDPAPAPYVPVRAAIREQIYRESPLFASMRSGIERWVGIGCPQVYRDPAVCSDIGGGHLMWAVRTGAETSGHAGSGAAMAAFFAALGAEIDAACDGGRLACGPPRSGMMPPLDSAVLRDRLPAALAGAIRLVIHFAGLRAPQRPSESGSVYLREMSAFIHAEVAPDRGAGPQPIGEVAGWVYLADHRPFEVALQSAGQTLPIRPSYSEGADVAAQLGDPAAHRLRFHLEGGCPAPCALALSVAGAVRLFPLEAGLAGARPIAGPQGLLYLDRVDGETEGRLVSAWPRQAKLAVLAVVAGLYRTAGPGLAAVAAAAWLLLAAAALSGRGAAPLVVASAPLLAGLCLAVVVALVDATSFRAVDSGYLSPVSAQFLLFAGIAIGSARRLLLSWLRPALTAAVA